MRQVKDGSLISNIDSDSSVQFLQIVGSKGSIYRAKNFERTI